MKIRAMVFPCGKFAPGEGLKPYRSCANCGFNECIHGLDGAALLAQGLFDPTKDQPGMEQDPIRVSFKELEAELKKIKNAPSGRRVLSATLSAPRK